MSSTVQYLNVPDPSCPTDLNHVCKYDALYFRLVTLLTTSQTISDSCPTTFNLVPLDVVSCLIPSFIPSCSVYGISLRLYSSICPVSLIFDQCTLCRQMSTFRVGSTHVDTHVDRRLRWFAKITYAPLILQPKINLYKFLKKKELTTRDALHFIIKNQKVN